ncbi:MAG: cyclodeaminase/cyclohydrolase family protein [Oscillospiraceae bacterium]|nr:cyclodeaminase/cyclohydrolase family protein [Oscillospiraceae bacterium]
MEEKKEKFKIEIYRKKDPDELTGILAETDGRLEVGSAAALTGAEACAFALKAARQARDAGMSGERIEFMLRNFEKQREYLVYLIDEDVKAGKIMKRAVKEGEAQKIEAARGPACAISDEVINQMTHILELLEELGGTAPAACAVSLGCAAELCLAAIRCARLFVVGVSRESSDDTYRFIVRRENEIRMQELLPKAEALLSRVEQNLL